jgi:hypothetical protein
VAFEFQRGDSAAMNTPLISPKTMLSFEERLSLIGKQVKQYQHMYKVPDEVKRLIEAMVMVELPSEL